MEREAIEIYSIMGGLDFNAIPFLFALFNVGNAERMLSLLITIRDTLNKNGE